MDGDTHAPPVALFARPSATHIATLLVDPAGVVSSVQGPGAPGHGLSRDLVGLALTHAGAPLNAALERARVTCLQASPSVITLPPSFEGSGWAYRLDDHGSVVIILSTSTESGHVDRMARVTDLGRWTRAFVHMLNNTLFGVLGYAEFGLKQANPDMTRNALTQIQRAGQRLRERGNTLLTYGRALEATHGQEHCSPAKAAQAAIKLVDSSGRDSGRISVGDIPETATVRGAESVVAQILANLIENALDATEGNQGSVTLSMTASAETFELSVQDTGCGMTPTMLSRATQPFVTTKAGTQESYAPGGMGLTLAIQMAAHIGGTLTLESAPDRGTTATLCCPSIALPQDA